MVIVQIILTAIWAVTAVEVFVWLAKTLLDGTNAWYLVGSYIFQARDAFRWPSAPPCFD
jgi:hypothetical protein